MYYIIKTFPDYKQAFLYYDKDGNGTISPEELRTIMMSFGQNPTADELDDLMKEIDIDGNEPVYDS